MSLESEFNKQKVLIDVIYEITALMWHPHHKEDFEKMGREERAAWVRRQLLKMGYNVSPPAGSSWGTLYPGDTYLKAFEEEQKKEREAYEAQIEKEMEELEGVDRDEFIRGWIQGHFERWAEVFKRLSKE